MFRPDSSHDRVRSHQGPRLGKSGRSSPTHRSSIAPVPKVALQARLTQPLTDQRGLLITARPAISGAPATRSPRQAHRGSSPLDTEGPRADAHARSTTFSQFRSHVRQVSPVTASSLRVDTCRLPQAKAVRRPSCRRYRAQCHVDRSGSEIRSRHGQLGRALIGCETIPVPWQRQAIAHGAEVWPRPMPARAGSPVARFQRTCWMPGWTLIPTLDSSPPASAAVDTIRDGAGDLAQIELGRSLQGSSAGKTFLARDWGDVTRRGSRAARCSTGATRPYIGRQTLIASLSRPPSRLSMAASTIKGGAQIPNALCAKPRKYHA